jgi:hypothetical protein
MCKFCVSVLGPHCKPHNENECPLKKSSYCSLCGPGKHFSKDCPMKPKKISVYIPSIKSIIKDKIYYLSNSNEVYIEYLRFHNLSFDMTLAKNKLLIQIHLQSKGYTLRNPITTHSTPVCDCEICTKKCSLKKNDKNPKVS